MNNEIIKVEANNIEEKKTTKNNPVRQECFAIITKCAYDKGKAHICVEYIGEGANEGVMRQVVLSAEDIIRLIEDKEGRAYCPPREAF